MTQRANFGAEQLTSQRRPREFMLQELVPVAFPTLVLLVLLVLLVVLVKTSVPLSPLVLLLFSVLTLLWMLMLLEVEAAPAPLTAKHRRRAR